MLFYCCKYCIFNILHIRAFVNIDFQGSLGKIIRFPADFHLSDDVPAAHSYLSGQARGIGILRRVIGI